jgi:hypothetical protein
MVCPLAALESSLSVCVAPRWPAVYFRKRPALASVMAPHNSKMKSSVKPNDSKSELSMASAKSIVLVFSWPISQIWVAAHQTTNKVFLVNNKLNVTHLNNKSYPIPSH